MKSCGLILLSALAQAKQYMLASWSDSGTVFEPSDIAKHETALYWAAESEWTAGLRNPAFWGEYMEWHEGAALTEEIYTYASFSADLNL